MTSDAAFTPFPVLATDRLSLRQIQPDDAAALFATLADEEAMRSYGHAPHRSLDETAALIQRIQANYADHTAIRWGITRHGEATVIGTCSFHHFDAGFHRAETGYELNRAYWRQGIMREALTAVLTYGFATLGLHRVEAIIDIANEQSKSLLLALGFTYEGNLRQRYHFQDRFEDEYYFGLLRDEWPGATPRS